MPRRLALLVATYRYQDEELQQLTAPGQDAGRHHSRLAVRWAEVALPFARTLIRTR